MRGSSSRDISAASQDLTNVEVLNGDLSLIGSRCTAPRPFVDLELNGQVPSRVRPHVVAPVLRCS